MCDLRIGHGYDVHRTGSDRDLIIGGVKIPCDFGLIAHSDGDVLVHAVMDAIFGASGMPDIGAHFPDTDDKYRGADSMALLCECVSLIADAGFDVVNIDSTIIAQRPKMKEYIPVMRENIARACHIPVNVVNIKATTEEHLGFTGSGEGIAAHVVCLLSKK